LGPCAFLAEGDVLGVTGQADLKVGPAVVDGGDNDTVQPVFGCGRAGEVDIDHASLPLRGGGVEGGERFDVLHGDQKGRVRRGGVVVAAKCPAGAAAEVTVRAAGDEQDVAARGLDVVATLGDVVEQDLGAHPGDLAEGHVARAEFAQDGRVGEGGR